MFKTLLLMAGVMFFTNAASAAVHSQDVDYKSPDGQILQGYLAFSDDAVPKKGSIIIVPDWMGVSQFYKDKANKLAGEGYTALVADVYGVGVRPTGPDQAGELATKYKSNRPLLRARIHAAYDYVRSIKNIDRSKILVMGYCFGGTTALELARGGATLAGVVSFHGGLSNPTPDDAKNIKAPVLVMHGADDPLVPPEEVKAFHDEMKAANVNLQFVSYPGAVHAFTNPAAGNDNSKGAAYNKAADEASWIEFEKFLGEVFK
jgi:dienelactone hydrolase